MLKRAEKESRECCSHLKCQAFVKCSMMTLLVLALVQIILSIFKGIFARNIARTQIVKVIMEAVLGDDDFINFENQVLLVSVSAALVTILGVLFVFFTLCSARYCHKTMDHLVTRSFVCFSSLLFLAIAIIYLIVGSSLWLVPSTFGVDYVNQQCEKATRGDFDSMTLDFKIVS